MRAPSMVADMTRMRRSPRKPCCTSRASASPRSASSERSWNSSKITAPTPSSMGSSRISRVKTPSVMISIRVRAEIFEPNRTRNPTVSPTRSPSVCAMRSAAARAASRRGSRTRIRRVFCAQSSRASTNGIRVVLPAPGGATSTAALLPRNAAAKSGSAASIGSGETSISFLVIPGHREAVSPESIITIIPDRFAATVLHRWWLWIPDSRFATSGMTGKPYIFAIMPAAQKTPPKPPSAAKPLKKGDHLFLVDGSGYIFRAYHALPPINRKSDGLQLNAVFGFCNMLWKLLREMKDDKPTHLAVVFDLSEKTFRTEMYPDYKAHRPDPPDDLKPQFGLIREAVHAFDLPCLEQGGFEADDLIATYVRQACEAGATATIVSSDKDLMQLVNDCVVMYDTMKDKKIGRAEVIEKFGVPPDKVIEVQAQIGDSTDNVPGVPSIGQKTAALLINEYGDLETLLKRAGEIKQDKRRQAIIDNADKARLSKKLVTLDTQVKVDVPIGDLAVHEPDYKLLIAFLKAMEFSSLTRRVAEFSSIDVAEIEPDAKLAVRGGSAPLPLAGEDDAQSASAAGESTAPSKPAPSPVSGARPGAANGKLTPQALAA